MIKQNGSVPHLICIVTNLHSSKLNKLNDKIVALFLKKVTSFTDSPNHSNYNY
jgi:hypothetical protein